MKNNMRIRQLPALGGVAVVGALLCAPTPAQAQTQEFFACYVPNSGVVYRVNPPGSPGESPDLKDDCTGKKHVKFSWAALAVANGKVGSFDVDGTLGASAFASASPLIFEAPKKTERMRIDDITGNVGIGTTSPGEKLTVAGTIESTTGGFKFPDGTTQTTSAAGAGDGHSLDAADGSPTDALFVDNFGKVGIGTTTPNHKLDVASNLSGVHFRVGGTNAWLEVFTGGNTNLRLGDGSGNEAGFISGGHNPAGANTITIAGCDDSGNCPVFTTFHESGKVGIGTATPSTALEVNGTVTATAFAVGREVVRALSPTQKGGGTQIGFAECPAGKTVIGGGGSLLSATGRTGDRTDMVLNGPFISGQGWQVQLVVVAPDNFFWQVEVHAICANFS